MAIDLLLDLDDHLLERFECEAHMSGVSLEEFLRRLLTETVGRPYSPLTDEDRACTDRPMVSLDLRSR